MSGVQRPTMREVAARAGVAIKTVSRVVNDVPTVDPVLADRVRTAMLELGYRPNLAASGLRRSDRRSHTIGLLVDDVSNPYAATVLRAVERFFGERGTLVLAASTEEDPLREQVLAKSLLDRGADGLVVMTSALDQDYLVAEQQAGATVVFIDRRPRPLIADAVVTDNRDGARRGVAHLLARPRRRIAYLGDQLSLPTAADRFAGFQDACRAGAVPDSHVVVRHGLTHPAAARAQVVELLRADPPDAVFASQNLITLEVVAALHAAGLQHRVAVVGFDEIPLAALLSPGITVMAQDPAAMGTRAAEVLLARLEGAGGEPRLHEFTARLVERGSGEIAT